MQQAGHGMYILLTRPHAYLGCQNVMVRSWSHFTVTVIVVVMVMVFMVLLIVRVLVIVIVMVIAMSISPRLVALAACGWAGSLVGYHSDGEGV